LVQLACIARGTKVLLKRKNAVIYGAGGAVGDLEWIMGRGLADCLRWPVGQPQPA
jgi:hypothetical protein